MMGATACRRENGKSLALVDNYPNNRMRRLRTGDSSPRQNGGEVCFGREEVGRSREGSHGKHRPCVLSICTEKGFCRGPCTGCLEKLLKTLPHGGGTLTLGGYSALCMTVITAPLKQVKVVDVSSFKCGREQTACLPKPAVISYFYSSPWKSQCDTVIRQTVFPPLA